MSLSQLSEFWGPPHKKAFKEASRIPEVEQDDLADLIFAAIKSEELDRDPEKLWRLIRDFRDNARSGFIERDSLELDWTPPWVEMRRVF